MADAGYGSSAAFRHALDERSLRFAVGILCTQKVYAADVALVPPPGRARKLIPDQAPRTVEAVLDERPWRRVTWRQGTKGKLSARFSALRCAGRRWAGLRQQPPSAGRRGLARGRVWRSSGERKYYLSNLPARITRRALVAAIKARWVCEQAHQQLKEELGLDHFEVRSWTGLHRHALMTCLGLLTSSISASPGRPWRGGGKNVGAASRTAAFAACRRAPSDHRAAASRMFFLTYPVPLLSAPLQVAA